MTMHFSAHSSDGISYNKRTTMLMSKENTLIFGQQKHSRQNIR